MDVVIVTVLAYKMSRQRNISDQNYIRRELLLQRVAKRQARPRAILKTKGTVFSFTNGLRPAYNIYFFRSFAFFHFAANGVEKILKRGPYCKKLDWLRARY